MNQIPDSDNTSNGDPPLGPRTGGQRVFFELQRLARAEGRSSGRPTATQDYVTRHILESFLDRLRTTGHANDFVLKGGLLLGAYDIRRPTKDVDSNAISATVREEWLTKVVRDVADCDAHDGVLFDAEAVRIETIREDAGYGGVRLRMSATVGPARGELVWDVSTGDPIVPPPRLVQLPRVLGDPIAVWSYAPETTVAEKAVTILERGITSTRWRDYVDIVQLHRQGLINRELTGFGIFWGAEGAGVVWPGSDGALLVLIPAVLAVSLLYVKLLAPRAQLLAVAVAVEEVE
jgi:hypothetical protein